MMVQLSSGGASFGASLGRHVDHRPRHEQRLAVIAVHEERRLGAPSCRRRHPPSAATRTSRPSGPGTAWPWRRCGTPAEVVTVSARALISSGPLVSGLPSVPVFTHGGTRPHRIEPHPPGRLVVGFGVPFDHGADGRRRRDVEVRLRRSLSAPVAVRLVDRLDLLGQQRRIGRHRESPTHVSHGGRTSRQGRMDAMTEYRGGWQAPSTTTPVHATVEVPGSKSQTNRALILAALATRRARRPISGALRSRDTDLMIGALRTLGLSLDGARNRADGRRGDLARRGRHDRLRPGRHRAAVRPAGRGARPRGRHVRRRRAGPGASDRAPARRRCAASACASTVTRCRSGARRGRRGRAAPCTSTPRRRRSSSRVCCCRVRRSATD